MPYMPLAALGCCTFWAHRGVQQQNGSVESVTGVLLQLTRDPCDSCSRSATTAAQRHTCKMWDDTADMPFEQRFIAHRTVPVGPAALELEQTPPTMGGTDPLGTACTVWKGGELLARTTVA